MLVSLWKLEVMMARTPPKTQGNCIENPLGLLFLGYDLDYYDKRFPMRDAGARFELLELAS